MKKIRFGMLAAILTLCSAAIVASSCSRREDPNGEDPAEAIADNVWVFSQSHPDGFTVNVFTLTEPSEGIAVSYAATQGSHSRDQLGYVVTHAMEHGGYVGGWYDSADGLYYFDSTRLFPEDSLAAAVQFGIENEQNAFFIISTSTEVRLDGKIKEIAQQGSLKVGTTGDYRPLTYREPETGEYWGFGIEMAGKIAEYIGVDMEFVQTSWPKLTSDVLAEPQLFDFAIGGITITDARREVMDMSEGYLANGKTILCRAEEADRFHSLADINQSGVKVMVNPGGLNEKFATDSLSNATVITHERNEEIPTLIAEGEADVMITEITEAPWYVEHDSRLAAPLLTKPFTRGEIGVLMRKGQEDLLGLVNEIIRAMKADGSLRSLHEEYGLVYAYD